MKMLKSKNIRRVCVLLAMLAPVVYLFGSLFAGLAGAHGTMVFGEPDVSDEVVFKLDYYPGQRLYPDGSVSPYQNFYTSVDFSFDSSSEEFKFIAVATGVNSYRYAFYADDSSLVYYFTGASNNTYFPIPSGAVSVRVCVESATLTSLDIGFKSSAGFDLSGYAYSDYVFGQFFAKDNFLEQIGKDVLSDNPHGFVPFAAFWKYLDNNMLHMGDMQLGLMGYGYVYYCCHVLLFDIAFILVTFFLDFIQKVNDKVVGGVD